MIEKYKELFECKEEFLLPSGRACPGCGGGIMTRLWTKATGGKNVVFGGIGSCGTSTTGMFPIGNMTRIPAIAALLGSNGPTLSGMREALNIRGMQDATVMALDGDGGAADIGFGAYSAMVERGHKVAVCVNDNEGYSATGGQRSGLTSLKAWTRTTHKGKDRPPKHLPFLLMAQDIPYTATANIGYPDDMYRKMKKALDQKNQPSLIQVLCPCIPNWKYEPRKVVEVSRLATETGMYPLYEYEKGSFRRTVFIKKKKPLQEYLKLQGRFDHVTEEDIKEMQAYIDALDRKIDGYIRMYSVEIF